jgi:uncharacterized protein
MILKFILFAIVALYIYKLLGGKLPSLKDIAKHSQNNDTTTDTLVECHKCGTYITQKEAKIIKGQYFCDECI